MPVVSEGFKETSKCGGLQGGGVSGKEQGKEGDLVFPTYPFEPFDFFFSYNRPAFPIIKIYILVLINGPLGGALKAEDFGAANPRLQRFLRGAVWSRGLAHSLGARPVKVPTQPPGLAHTAEFQFLRSLLCSVWSPPWGTAAFLAARLSAPCQACPVISWCLYTLPLV